MELLCTVTQTDVSIKLSLYIGLGLQTIHSQSVVTSTKNINHNLCKTYYAISIKKENLTN